MNYLAHVLLGDQTPPGLVGSLMGDFVRGPVGDDLPAAVANAVRVHRAIDSYADAHPIHRRSRDRFLAPRRRFAGVVVDVCYDHFLTVHWSRFGPESLESFVARVYRALHDYPAALPERLAQIAPRMAAQDWLGSYRELEAVGWALDGIASRRPRARPLLGGIAEVRIHYAALEQDFLDFFPDLERHTRGLLRSPG